MFKGHPKGLYVVALSNMGERFGYYTMVAIFTMFIQAKYGFDAKTTSYIYGVFIALVYFLPLLGGVIADRVLGYGKTVTIGIVVMFIGYLLLSIPTPIGEGLGFIYVALGVIALGTGLFKGNLQALTGNMYDDPKYSHLRDSGFNIFYMCINVGAMFAPTAADAVMNWGLAKSNFIYDGRIPALANQYLKGTLTQTGDFLSMAQLQNSGVTLDTLKSFSTNYLNALSTSYHYGFAVACISLVISIVIFLAFRKYYKSADMSEAQKNKANTNTNVEMTPHQTRQRLTALILVFIVVIFFWMAFQQNAVTMTYFARDYTSVAVGKYTNIWFDLFTLLSISFALLGGFFVVKKGSKMYSKIYGAVAFVVFGIIAFFRVSGYKDVNPFTPQMFQHFNPFFIVVMTPFVIGFFAWLAKKGKEPTAPQKIGWGMLVTAFAFLLLVIASIGLPSPNELHGAAAPLGARVSTYWLISTYFTLTIAELFLSPMGISFVSKVAPPKYKGLMMGGWFAATAIGNYLVGEVGGLWDSLSLPLLWTIFVVACLVSALFIFSINKRIEKASTT